MSLDDSSRKSVTWNFFKSLNFKIKFIDQTKAFESYTLLCIKQKTNENRLYDMEKSTQYSVMT